jgi:hypothetical protein
MKLPGFILLFYFHILPFVGSFGGLRAGEQLVASYMQEGNYSQALVLANEMPSLYGLTGDELTEHNYYMDMLNLQTGLAQQGRNILQLNSSELNSLVLIAESSIGTAGTQAKNILEFFYGAHFFNCQVLDDSATSKSYTVNPNELGEAYGLNITVKPNPAKDWAAFDYTLPGDESTAILIITDANGKNIESISLDGNQGQKLWDTRHIPAGAYIYTLKSISFSKTGKIVITK